MGDYKEINIFFDIYLLLAKKQGKISQKDNYTIFKNEILPYF